ncbi:MAG: zinc-finger domain of monoamine-oxidase A repressor R1-domain-containing protein [Monoraphidium minutum]|nr:MAG: zinc-finger domain of monoamine-oxidase A repressor R1-domain-containing protein [Monoraphidium minutum]
MAEVATTDLSAYEREREARIAANKQKIAELGINDTVAAVQQLADPKPSRPKRKAAPAEPVDPSDIRRSARPRTEVNYRVDIDIRGEGSAREPVDYTEKIKQLQLDSEAAEKLRAEQEARRAEEGGKKARKDAKSRGPKDSGKGVRVQGGRVYDSKFGVTCHWCRQKTLEAHVTCTHPKCRKNKMPYSFCHKCLKNRHGEDAEEEAEKGTWVCPSCRGSCGPGCVICCNCGPCRKKAGLEPTAQIVFLARSAGFSNVHDYLVHLVTGEKEEEVAARKDGNDWGVAAYEEAAASGSGGGEGGEEGAPKKKQARARKAPAGKAAAAAAAEAGGGAEAGEAPAVKGKGKGRKSAAAEEEAAAPVASPAPASAKGKGKGRKSAAAEEDAAAPVASPAAPASAKGKAKGKASATKAKAKAGGGEGGSPPDVEAPAGGDQDAKLSRKARMMARMGLAGRSDSMTA